MPRRLEKILFLHLYSDTISVCSISWVHKDINLHKHVWSINILLLFYYFLLFFNLLYGYLLFFHKEDITL